jgi:hypothetical protein
MGTIGLSVMPARQRNVFDKTIVTRMRVMFSISFHDIRTKQAVTPTNPVTVQLISPANATTTVTLTETVADTSGIYTGSFLPTVSGEWRATALQGTEVVDKARFYVQAA